MADSRFFTNAGPFTLQQLAETAQAELQNGSPDAVIKDVAALHQATSEQISFLDNRKYVDSMRDSKAGAVILRAEHTQSAPEHTALLITETPYHAYARVAQQFYPTQTEQQESIIADTAQIDPSATIGIGCRIGEYAVIGPNVIIGDHCVISAQAVIGQGVTIGHHCIIGIHATISHAIIGNHVYIYRGVCIGQDGFGFAMSKEGHLKIPQLGRVIIEDNVEVGAATCIDRGAGPDTIIGEGTFIDNQVQIGHNVQVGKRCVIVAQVGISGSCILEDDVVLGGQVGVMGHTTLGKGSMVLAKSGISRNIPEGSTWGGFPAVPAIEWHRSHAVIRKLTRQRTSINKESKE